MVNIRANRKNAYIPSPWGAIIHSFSQCCDDDDDGKSGLYIEDHGVSDDRTIGSRRITSWAILAADECRTWYCLKADL